MIEFTIPGEPYALKRHRTAVRGKHAIAYDPKENRDWKATAGQYMRDAMGDRDPFAGPVHLTIDARFSMPKSRHLKKTKRPGEWHTKRPDLDNIVKAVKDAAKGILWLDDSQVCKVYAEKWTQVQGAAPGLRVTVERV